MPTEVGVFTMIRAIVVDQLGVDEDEVTTEAHLIEDLGADSLDLIEIEMALEEEFDVCVDEDISGKLLVVGELVTWVKQQTGR